VAAVEVSECDVGGEGLLLHIKAQRKCGCRVCRRIGLDCRDSSTDTGPGIGLCPYPWNGLGGAGAGAREAASGELELKLGRCTTGSSGEELVDPRTWQLMPIINDGHASSSVSRRR
jgi:hypothetical protein